MVQQKKSGNLGKIEAHKLINYFIPWRNKSQSLTASWCFAENLLFKITHPFSSPMTFVPRIPFLLRFIFSPPKFLQLKNGLVSPYHRGCTGPVRLCMLRLKLQGHRQVIKSSLGIAQKKPDVDGCCG